MAINVTLGEAKPQEVKPFPKLMTGNSGWIIYAISETEVFHLAGPFAGEYTNEFKNINMSFEDYNEPITLQNE